MTAASLAWMPVTCSDPLEGDGFEQRVRERAVGDHPAGMLLEAFGENLAAWSCEKCDNPTYADELRKQAAHIDAVAAELAADFQVPPDALTPLHIYAVELREQASKEEVAS